jgi:hypothetical protein
MHETDVIILGITLVVVGFTVLSFQKRRWEAKKMVRSPMMKPLPSHRGKIQPHSLHLDSEGQALFWVLEEAKTLRRVVVKHIIRSCLAGTEYDETGPDVDVLNFVPFEDGIIASNKTDQVLWRTLPESEVRSS